MGFLKVAFKLRIHIFSNFDWAFGMGDIQIYFFQILPTLCPSRACLKAFFEYPSSLGSSKADKLHTPMLLSLDPEMHRPAVFMT